MFTAVSLPKIKNTKFLLKVPGIFKAITKEVAVTSANKWHEKKWRHIKRHDNLQYQTTTIN